MKELFFLGVWLIAVVNSYGQGIVWNYSYMERLKSSPSGNAEVRISLDLLKKQADAFVKLENVLSVANKKKTVVSDNLHDYVSMATYYWPNPIIPGGVPYIRKDGKTNPEVNKIRDLHNLTSLCKRVEVLSLAYYYFGEKKYAEKARSLISGWFIASNTKMNPNFNHAQFIKGQNKGRIEGIVEARNFINLLDGVLILHNKGALTNDDYLSIKNWFKGFLDWMEKNSIGKNGNKLTNNIGTCYQLQRLAYSIFIGKDQIDNIVANNLKLLIKQQFNDIGAQQKELSRTKPVQYSIANLDYWQKIELILKNKNYNYQFIDQSLRGGVNYVNGLSRKGENLDKSHTEKILRMNKKFRNNVTSQNKVLSKQYSLDDAISFLTIN